MKSRATLQGGLVECPHVDRGAMTASISNSVLASAPIADIRGLA